MLVLTGVITGGMLDRGSIAHTSAPSVDRVTAAVNAVASSANGTMESGAFEAWRPSSSRLEAEADATPVAAAGEGLEPEANGGGPTLSSKSNLGLISLISGGIAGIAIDTSMYPIDTMKTRRMQGLPALRPTKPSDFYRGIPAVILPAIPASAAFFLTYEKLREAFEDAYKHTNLMAAEWTDHEERVRVVGEMFKENRLLVDLSHQPGDIQRLIVDTVITEFNHNKRFNLYNFLTFVGTYELKRISDYLDSYIPMLS